MMRLTVFLASAFALSAALSACGGAGGPNATLPAPVSQPEARASGALIDWDTFGFNRERWSYNGSETTLTPGTVKNLTLKWSIAIGSNVSNTQPIVAANVVLSGGRKAQVVYAGDESGRFIAVDALAGTAIWSKRLGKTTSSCFGGTSVGVTSTPAIDRASNRIYVLDGLGKLWAFNPGTGAQDPAFPAIQAFKQPQINHTWSGLLLDATGATLYYPTASHCDNGVYYGTIDSVNTSSQKIVTFQLVTDKSKYYGNGVWSWGGESIDPATGDLYAGVGNSLGGLGEDGQYSDSVIELTHDLGFVADEQPESNLQNDLDIGTTPVLFDSGGKCAAFERKDGNFFTVDRTHLRNGNFATKLNLGGSLATPAWSPATHALYAAVPNGLTKLNGGAGCKVSVAWQTPIGASGNSVPAVAGAVVYAAGGSTLYAVDASSGAILWNSGSAVGNTIVAEPTVVNGRVYVTAWDGRLYAFGL